jgi:hypothetical protein
VYQELFGNDKINAQSSKFKPVLTNQEKISGKYQKYKDIFYYDKFGNKKKDDQKKGEIFDRIEKDVVDFDLMYLKEHQE